MNYADFIEKVSLIWWEVQTEWKYYITLIKDWEHIQEYATKESFDKLSDETYNWLISDLENHSPVGTAVVYKKINT
jgi:hypothetical protein